MKNLYCYVCGTTVKNWLNEAVIWDDLAAEWNLNQQEREYFSLRESSFCKSCLNSARTRGLAEALLSSVPFEGCVSLKEWVNIAQQKGLKVAEINSCGRLHPFLASIPDLYYSEYADESDMLWRVRNRLSGKRMENIMNLTYKDNFFDVVLHSEVLEHVPNPQKAIEECKRVLKPEGVCLFTTPAILSRATLCRAKMDPETGSTAYLRKPVYHGRKSWLLNLTGKSGNLVWWEFGGDIIKKFNLRIYTSIAKETDVFILTK